jgi:hypothetical protein
VQYSPSEFATLPRREPAGHPGGGEGGGRTGGGGEGGGDFGGGEGKGEGGGGGDGGIGGFGGGIGGLGGMRGGGDSGDGGGGDGDGGGGGGEGMTSEASTGRPKARSATATTEREASGTDISTREAAASSGKSVAHHMHTRERLQPGAWGFRRSSSALRREGAGRRRSNGAQAATPVEQDLIGVAILICSSGQAGCDRTACAQ